MFARYTGKRSRSLSSADVYRIDDELEAQGRAGASAFSTLSRQIRRPSTRPPPVPPRRSDSFSAPSTSSSTSSLEEAAQHARVRSYLSDDIRREFESTARLQHSPSSRNFVRKLVATLERRQSKDGALPVQPTYQRSFRDPSSGDASVIKPSSPALDFAPRLSQLEEVHEEDNEDEESGSSDSDSDDYLTDERGAAWPPVVRSYPAHPSGSKTTKSGKGRLRLKSVFSSLMNWRIGSGSSGSNKGQQLPKGSRDYYAGRESLGEEMRLFRRDTMPRLMEHAALNSRLPELRSFGCNNEPVGRCRRDTQDFARLIRRPPSDEPRTPSPPPVATIHPVYGSCKASVAAYAAPLPPPEPPVLFAHPQVQICTSSPPDEALLRPSRLRELQKRLSREIDMAVQHQLHQRPRSVQLYDVPSSNRPVLVHEYDSPAGAHPHYQNIGQAVSVSSSDKRLSCTLFTTF